VNYEHLITFAPDNAHLLYELHHRFGASGFGAIHKFFQVDPDWRCPCCYRNKSEMARLDKNGDLLCAIHEHHDHFDQVITKMLPLEEVGDYSVRNSVINGLTRFPPTQICNDCNVVEPAAKRAVGAEDKFSFTPYEISSFIIVAPNVPHKFDVGRVEKAYVTATEAMKLISERLREIRRAVRGDGLTQIGSVFPRVLDDVARKMRSTEDAA
jgi:rubredoxin